MAFSAQRFRGWLVAALLAVVALGGFVRADSSAAMRWDSIVARVNGETVSRGELARFLLRAKGSEWLRAITLRKAILREAEKRGVSVSQAELDDRLNASVEARLQALAQSRNINAEQLAQALSESGQDIDALRESLKGMLSRVAETDMLAEKLMRLDITLADHELRDAYDEKYGPRIRVRHIEIASIGDAMEIVQALDRGAGFERLAEDRTLDRESRQRDYELLPSPSPKSNIGRRAANLAPGRRAIVREGERYHVIELIERVQGEDVAFEEVADKLRESLIQRKIAEQRDAFISDVLKTQGVQVNLDPASDDWGAAVARVGQEDIRLGDLADELIEEFGDVFVNLMTRSIAVRQEADRRAVSVDETKLREATEEQVELRLNAEARAMGLENLAAYDQRLRIRGGALDERRRSLVAEGLPYLRLRWLAEECLMKDLTVSEEDARNEFHRRYDAKVKARQIVSPRREEAEQALRFLERGADFAELVRQVSIDRASHRKGGVFEVRKQGLLGEALADMDIGERRIVAVGRFYHLVEKLEDIPAQPKRFESMREEIKSGLLAEKARRERDFWIMELEAKADIETFLD